MQVFSAPDALERLAANPKTAPYLVDPAFMAKFQAIQKNPAALQMNMDEKILNCMMVLLGQGGAVDEPGSAPSAEEQASAKSDAAAKPEEPKAEPEPEPEPASAPAEKTEEEKISEAAAAEKALGTVA